MEEKQNSAIFHFVKSDGKTAALLRSIQWDETLLGPAALWPAELLSYVNIIINTPSPMCMIWGPKRIQLFNDQYLHLFETILPISAFGTPFTDTSPELSSWMDPLISSGRSGIASEIMLSAGHAQDQVKQTLSLAYSPVYLEGNVHGVLFTSCGSPAVLEQKQKRSEDRALFQILSNASPILTATCNAEGSADYFSDSWLRLTGLKTEELLGYGWIAIIHPEDSQSFLDLYKEAVESKKEWKGSFRIRSGDGNYILLAASGTPLYNQNDTFLGYISSSVDITQQHRLISSLQQSQQQLGAMIQKAPIGICLLDARTLVSEVVNDSFLEVAGKPYEAIAGQYYWDSLPRPGRTTKKPLPMLS